jgi:hypothetical protein
LEIPCGISGKSGISSIKKEKIIYPEIPVFLEIPVLLEIPHGISVRKSGISDGNSGKSGNFIISARNFRFSGIST